MSCNCPVEHWDIILINILSRKLDFASKRVYEEERQRDSNTFPTLKEFFDILERRCLILETMHSGDSFSTKNLDVKPKFSHKTTLLGNVKLDNEFQHQNSKPCNVHNIKIVCIFCKQTSHKIYTCAQFKNLNFKEKSQFVSANQLCFNCLGSKHVSNKCTSSQFCRVCSRKHHTLLHNDYNNSRRDNNSESLPVNRISQQNYLPLASSQIPTDNRADNFSREGCLNQAQSHNSTSNYSSSKKELISEPHSQTFSNLNPEDNPLSVTNFSSNHSQVLLATGLVTLYSKDKEPILVRILFDNGSQTNFITQTLANKLKLKPYDVNLNILGIGKNVTMSQKMVDLLIPSKLDNRHFEVRCAILDNITCKLPQIPIDFKKLNIPPVLELADPTFFDPGHIDILLSASIYSDMLCEGFIRLGKNLPILQSTHLGWIIVGNIPAEFTRNQDRNSMLNVSLCTQTALQSENLDSLLTKFWTLEEVSAIKSPAPEDALAEQIFQSSFLVLECGTVQVDLPLKGPYELEKLGDTFSIALKRLENLKKSMMST